MQRELTEQLHAARAGLADAARPDLVTRIHGGGKLTPRERLERLVDADSLVPYGTIAAVDPAAGEGVSPWIPETGGLDAIATIGGRPVIVSTTDYTDHGGGYGAARLGRLYALAREHRWPVVSFVDGGGSRARHPRSGLGNVELSGAVGPYTVFDGMAELSGWVPTVSIVSGPSFAGHASIAGFSDVVIATRGSAIGMGGPPMVEAAIGRRLTPQELSSAEMQYAAGGIELLVDDEPGAIAAVQDLLGYWRAAPVAVREPVQPPGGIGALVPVEGGYDVHGVLDALVDAGSFFELRAPFAPAVVVGLARLGGRSVGVIASNPQHEGGRIDERAAQKISRHVELCDAWELPLLVLVDSAGTDTRWVQKDRSVVVEPGLSRMHMRCLVAHQTRTCPLLAIQMRLGRGLAPALMTGYSTGVSVPAFLGAWPAAEFNGAEGFAMVRDANAFDDVVDPDQTRALLVRLLRVLPAAPSRTAKSRPIDSW